MKLGNNLGNEEGNIPDICHDWEDMVICKNALHMIFIS